MSLLTVEATNFLIHKYVKINVNKQSLLVIGDTGTGKSTFSKLIRSHLGIEQYPANPLPDDANEGETKTTHSAPDGRVYSVSRKYVREKDGSVKLDRFEVRGPAGKERSLEYVMETIFQGAFTAGRFDYNTYFNKKKGTVDRFKYFVEAMGDKTIEENAEKIELLEEERATIGNDRTTKKALWAQISDSKDEAAMQVEMDYYSTVRTTDEATAAREEHLTKRTSLKSYENKLDTHAKAIEMMGMDDQAIRAYTDEIADIDRQMIELQRRRNEKETQIKSRQALKDEQKKNVLSNKALDKMAKEVIKIERDNKIIETEAEAIYKTKLDAIFDFLAKKQQFFNGLQAFEDWSSLDTQWKEKDQSILTLKAQNEETLKKLLPIPDMEIGIKNKKPVVLYKGRELSDEYFSTGEQIEIALAIQVALNPTGDNFIVIPNAQNLGSKLRDVQASCKKYNIQYLVEMTKPDEEFVVEVIDSEKDII